MKEQITLAEAYRTLNGSFRETCVFHVGASAGFFSEYNMMLLAMLYCLQRRIRFTLYSDDANFSSGKGWTDYFEPFCEEAHSPLHRKFNQRPVGSWRSIWRTAMRQRRIGYLVWKLKSELLRLPTFVHKRLTHARYYTQDVWKGILALKAHDRYRIPELGIDGNLADALHVLARLTWRLNPATTTEIEAIRSTLALPETYIGCQIRGGDKFIEFSLVPTEDYLRTFASLRPETKDIFVLTDDYRIMRELTERYKEYRWHSLCRESEQGYFHRSFVRNGREERRARIVRFLASIDTLTGASLYVGTRTSNPSVFLYIYMPEACADTDGNGDLLSNSTLGIE